MGERMLSPDGNLGVNVHTDGSVALRHMGGGDEITLSREHVGWLVASFLPNKVDRTWTETRDPVAIREATDYALAFFWKDHAPMPEPDVRLAEVAMSLVFGFIAGTRGEEALRERLQDMQRMVRENPTRWPIPE